MLQLPAIDLRQVVIGFGGAALLFASTLASAEVTGSTRQIYQQRTADGRLLLTDRPAPEALTERTWLVPMEDAVAARQRGLDVQNQANIVAERVQRRLIEQERLAIASARSFEPRRRESRRYDDDLDADDGYGYGVPILVGTPLRHGGGRTSFGRLGAPERHDGHTRGHTRGRMSANFTAPATLGSR